MRHLIPLCAIALPAAAAAFSPVPDPPSPDAILTPRCLDLLAALDRGSPLAGLVADLEADAGARWLDAQCLAAWYAPPELVAAARPDRSASLADGDSEPEPLPLLAWETGDPVPPVEAGVPVEATTHVDVQLLSVQVAPTSPASGAPWDAWPPELRREQRRWARRGEPPIEPPDLVAFARVGSPGAPDLLIAALSYPYPKDGHVLQLCGDPTFTGIPVATGVIRVLVVDRDWDDVARAGTYQLGERVGEVWLGPADFAEALRTDGPVIVDVWERTGGRVASVKLRAEGSPATVVGAWSRIPAGPSGGPDWDAVRDWRTGRCL